MATRRGEALGLVCLDKHGEIRGMLGLDGVWMISVEIVNLRAGGNSVVSVFVG